MSDDLDALRCGQAVSVEALKQQAKKFKDRWQFGLARRALLDAQAKAPADITIHQQLALCTYKDEDLLPATRYADALAILENVGLRDPANRNAETLALGGAVYKRLWEYRGRLEYLYEALALYQAAYERNPQDDCGYGGVNAAFILDLLAERHRAGARRTGIAAPEVERLAAQARVLRTRLVQDLTRRVEADPALQTQYWFAVTLAEVHYGLGEYDQAGHWLNLARRAAPDDWLQKEWELQSTFKQLATIAGLQGLELPPEGSAPALWPPAWQVLRVLLGEAAARALPCYRGKVGLALSGGGLRAAFFHLGVLARLAEIDALRSIEVLSTVSGGSIVGAQYHLEVKNLLQTRPDGGEEAISRADYIAIVQRIQQTFLAATQTNLRMRTLASLWHNLRLFFDKNYTLSQRLGELFETVLYARVADGHGKLKPRRLTDLAILPKHEPASFKPRFSNWRRRAKVPVLLLNATSLNTGHVWQFTNDWMGEPPALLGEEIDQNPRYRRASYAQAPTAGLQAYRLGAAVAASAAVPGLFEPLAIDRLYPDHTVRLVDGSVHDNQGVQGLLNEGCTLVLCSDGSSQMPAHPAPSSNRLGVLQRAGNILMDRVREAEYQDLSARADSKALTGLFFVHLKKGLTVTPVDWRGDQKPEAAPTGTTPHGIDGALQRQLAAVRTDFDAFTEVEACALMLSGYLMTEYECQALQSAHEKDGERGTWGGFDVHAPRGDWPFLALAPLAAQPPDSPDPRRQDLARQLTAAASPFTKVWQLDPVVRWTGIGLGAVVAGLIPWLIWRYWEEPLGVTVTVGGLVILLVMTLAASIVPAVRWLNPQKASQGLLRKALLALVGYCVGQLDLRLFNRRFLRRGQLRRLLE